jgi:hypothetical protein
MGQAEVMGMQAGDSELASGLARRQIPDGQTTDKASASLELLSVVSASVVRNPAGFPTAASNPGPGSRA